MATIIEMPKLSDTMSVGTVVKWHKKIGDTISNGDVLAEIETDKATMELECFDDGTLLKIFVGEGEEVPIGSPLAAVGEEGETVEDLPSATTGEEADEGVTTPSETASEKEENSDDSQPEDESGEAPATTGTVHGEEGGETSAKSSSSERIIASPLAKKIALEEKIDLSKVTGTGPSGRITKKDVLSFVQAPAEKAVVVPSSDSQEKVVSTRVEAGSLGNLKEQSVPVSKMRSIIASRLLESKNTIPHFYLQKEIDSQPLRLAREAMNERLANRCSPDEQPLKLTLNDIILKACAETIKWIPEINTSWEEKEIRFHGNVHLSFGVAVDDGLVTPVIRNAESLDLITLSLEAKSLIEKARGKKLSPDEMSGSTFTVTNLGMFGIDFFSGIINPPNAAILSIGASVKKPVLDSSGNLRAGETMTLGLSCDHRLVDGAVAARFLKLLGETLERPASLLV
ncbi:2-oxo acid dehydrogenase subunit E2 [Verrucomicrobia bacterium]|nr:2-oxo acid dehydrogenase subunit E2 [Verrucomicrobiota bacterium]